MKNHPGYTLLKQRLNPTRRRMVASWPPDVGRQYLRYKARLSDPQIDQVLDYLKLKRQHEAGRAKSWRLVQQS